MADQARQAREQTREQAQGLFQKIKQRSPESSQILGFLALITTAGISVFVGGLTVTGVIIALVLLTPVFLFFSPILVPAGIILFLSVAGVLTAAGAFVAFLTAVSWLYNYFKGRRPPGAEHVEHLRMRTMEAAEQLKQKAKEAGTKAKDAAPGA